MVEVKLFAQFRDLAGEDTVSVEPEKAPLTIEDAISDLTSKCPQLREKLIDSETEELQGGVIVMINGRNISYLDGLETQLQSSDRVAIFPPIAGG
ncbi:MAG: ubiquitin-like small modifier protein 1 [Candidatus Bipolaricaulota bacterium]